jgi:trigger factor
MDQYLMLIKKSAEEYEESLKPDAEKRVRQQLVLDEVTKRENIQVSPEELESIFRFYSQLGQPLPQTEEQVRGLASSLLREKAISRLIELTTDPDPDEEAEAEEAAEEAALAAAVEAGSLENEGSEAVVAAEEEASEQANASAEVPQEAEQATE